jgi:hypothetical protein
VAQSEHVNFNSKCSTAINHMGVADGIDLENLLASKIFDCNWLNHELHEGATGIVNSQATKLACSSDDRVGVRLLSKSL